jgi:2-aminoadipate transaminase
MRFAQRTKNVKASSVREILKLTQRPDMISFAGGLPAPELFPIERFEAACHQVLSTAGAQALQYSTTEGYPPLREMIVNMMTREEKGIALKPENILITASSQQALDLVAKLLINSGDRILVESPSYLGAFQAFNLFSPEYVSLPIDDNGLQTALLPEAIQTGPKFMYLLPNFQNPGGVTLSLERRKQIVKAANDYGIPILEDDPYGQLRYEGDYVSPLYACDHYNIPNQNGHYTGNVIYLSTFSKTLAPGFRLGWIAAPLEVISKLVQIKQGADLHTSTFAQMVVYEAAKDGFIEQHIAHLRDVYRERRDMMLESLDEFFPAQVKWTHPKGGLFLWVTLPEGGDSLKLLEAAVKQNVAFVPGDGFFANPQDGKRHLRLNFSNASLEMIRQGIHRLSVAVKEQLMQKVTA